MLCRRKRSQGYMLHSCVSSNLAQVYMGTHSKHLALHWAVGRKAYERALDKISGNEMLNSRVLVFAGVSLRCSWSVTG